MAKKKKKGSISKSKMISKMAGKFAGPQSHYPPAVARDVSKRGKVVDRSGSVSLANANSTSKGRGESEFIYKNKLYKVSEARGGSPTLVRKMTV